MQSLCGPKDDTDILGPGGRSEVNDHLAYHHEPSFRVLSALLPPDTAQLFGPAVAQGLPMEGARPLCAALGSTWLRPPGWDAILAGAHLGGSSLYHQYLECLQTLLAPPESAAPEVFHTAPWAVKQHQTCAAGGWAQLRHAQQLHSKETRFLLCLTDPPQPGFVEPVPDFFAGLATLVGHTRLFFDHAGALVPHPDGAVTALLDMAEKEGVSERWRLLAQSIQNGESLSPENEKLVQLFAPDQVKDLGSRWYSLEELCRSLQRLARAQLEGSPRSPADTKLILKFGDRLMEIAMFTNAPPDDAPRVARCRSGRRRPGSPAS